MIKIWNLIGTIDDKIIITKATILKYSKIHEKFQKEDILNYFFYIYRANDKNQNILKNSLKQQIETKLNYLLKEGFLKKEGKFILTNKSK